MVSVLCSLYLYLENTRVSFNFSANCLKYCNLRDKLRIVHYVHILEHFPLKIVSKDNFIALKMFFWVKRGEKKDLGWENEVRKVQLSKIIGRTLCNHPAENYRVSLSYLKKCFTRSVSPTFLWWFINNDTMAMWSRTELSMV